MTDLGVDALFQHYERNGMESRTNYVLVEERKHRCTMIADRGPVLSISMTSALTQQLRALLHPGDILVLTGDARNVEDTSIYTCLAQEAGALGAQVALDASGPYLAEGLKSNPFLIKPNFEELCYLSGKELTGEKDILDALGKLLGAGVSMIAMTWGSNGAFFASGDQIYRIEPIAVRAANEAGCGDAYLAAILAGLTQKMDTVEMLTMAAAVSAATAECELTAGFDENRMQELRKLVRISRLR